jgi:hypothetical protein
MKPLRWMQQAVTWLGRGIWLAIGRQPLTIVSAIVLVALAGLVLTSDSFESRKEETDSASERPLLIPDTTPTHRPSVLFYVVNDAAQRDEIAAAIQADRMAFADGGSPNDLIVYLLAGTKEEEARTIARLNFEEAAARDSKVDMRVIDLRGRFD